MEETISAGIKCLMVLHNSEKTILSCLRAVETKLAIHIYIQSATWNDNPLDKVRIPFKEIVAGGKLVLEMGPEPNKNWVIQN